MPDSTPPPMWPQRIPGRGAGDDLAPRVGFYWLACGTGLLLGFAFGYAISRGF